MGRRIRLLSLNRSKLDQSEGTLIETYLDTAPPFYALSHTWGSRKLDQTHHLGNEIIKISFSLKHGIYRLHELAKEGSHFSPPLEYIWIDSLCINQDDINERSHQVRLMGDIYTRAIKTMVWLGLDIETSQMAWSMVDTIYDVFRAQCPLAKYPEDISARIYSQEYHFSSGLPGWEDERWEHLKELCENQWFSRTWIIQEVVLSREDPIIVHGQHICQWDRFEWAATWMRRTGFLRLPRLPQALLQIDTIGYIRRAELRWPLDALMSIPQMKFRASDQRDKVYGLLGLASEKYDPENLPDDLNPDYSLSVPEVYRRITLRFLERSGSLAILTRAHGASGNFTRRRRRNHYPHMPSWVVNCSDLAFDVQGIDIRHSLCFVHSASSSRSAYLGFPAHYSAAGTLPLTLHRTDNPEVLGISGFKACHITQVLQMGEEHVLHKEFVDSFDVTMARVFSMALILLRKNQVEIWIAQFIKTTTAEQYILQISNRGWEQFLRDSIAFLHKLLLSNQELRTQFISRSGTGDNAMEWLKYASEGGDSSIYATLAYSFCYSRCFFVTSSDLMGIGPSDTTSGDAVAILPGGAVPYIIRESWISSPGGGWQLVGESYVNDLMRGEALSVYPDGMPPVEVLQFR